jgi:hypothetical protein
VTIAFVTFIILGLSVGDRGMKIVGVHGIAHEHLSAPDIELEWLSAIQGGLELAGFERISRKDFAIAAYGDLFRPSGTRGGLPMLSADDVTDEWEIALLEAWWRKAAELSELNRSEQDPLGEDPTIQGPDFEGRGRLLNNMVQPAVRQLTKSRFVEKLGGERVILFVLKQVREYLHNPVMKAAIRARVEARVTEDTRVIVGHSLGSVVAYECLCAHPEWNVETLVTVGSPLGIKQVFNALDPSPVNGGGGWPNVKQWFNVADRGDIVALHEELAPLFGDVTDLLVHNGSKSHAASRYLNAVETGRAIATGL